MKTDKVDAVVLQIATEYKESLKKIYGNDLIELILFGSHATNTAHAESDVDFALILKHPNLIPFQEIIKTAPVSSALSIKYGLMISTLPISIDNRRNSMQGIHQEIRDHGIAI